MRKRLDGRGGSAARPLNPLAYVLVAVAVCVAACAYAMELLGPG